MAYEQGYIIGQIIGFIIVSSILSLIISGIIYLFKKKMYFGKTFKIVVIVSLVLRVFTELGRIGMTL